MAASTSSDAWDSLYLALVAHSIDATMLTTEVIPDALAKCIFTQPAPNRLWACRVFGACAKQLDAVSFTESILSRVIALCQDTDHDVRAGMCSQLGDIVRCVGCVVFANAYVLCCCYSCVTDYAHASMCVVLVTL